jgi:glycerophosphoryl diester phosphodiesterase
MLLSLLLASQIYVIAHRGDHVHHAENSIAAIESAAAIGADFAELDVRTTTDGKLVLMHDKTVDRTTDGHGEVKDMTVAQQRQEFALLLVVLLDAAGEDVVVPAVDFDFAVGEGSGDRGLGAEVG